MYESRFHILTIARPGEAASGHAAFIVSTHPGRFATAGLLEYGYAFASRCAVKPDWAAVTKQVKAASDIVAVIGSYVPSLRQAGASFKGLCPFHDDKHPSFVVDPKWQNYRCWACGKSGDVITFVQEIERISFPEARDLLAHRAGISLENLSRNPQGPSRASMFEVMRWATEQFQTCLLESPLAEAARVYLGERKLTGETVRGFGLGFAPGMGDWLVQQAAAANMSGELLETVGLIAKRNEGRGTYDRFRDRVMFPIRDLRGETVGFGGRILPTAPNVDRAPKYYNSSETPLFSKSELLYGADRARTAAAKTGYLAIVEGYTDVMMAHQHGIANVVATMGTALNAKHVKKLRSLAERIVLVFDADAGGDSGVDRALEVFVSNDIDLRVANLPGGLDPCDLLVAEGPAPFCDALERAVEVFEFKLERLCATVANEGADGRLRAAEQILTILAAVADDVWAANVRTVNSTKFVQLDSQRIGRIRTSSTIRAGQMKWEVMVNRMAHRFNLKEETLWLRLLKLRDERQTTAKRNAVEKAVPAADNASAEPMVAPPATRSAPAARHEIQLIEVLLANANLVARAKGEVKLQEMEHPGLRLLLECLYRLETEGRQADLDHLRERVDNEKLMETARQLQDRGLQYLDGAAELEGVLKRFVGRRIAPLKLALRERLEAGDNVAVGELQRQLRDLSKRMNDA